MLTGEKLGQAIKAAIETKAVTQRAVAEHFGVKPPSVQDWIKRGTIGKEKLPQLWDYFADVAGPRHWGLERFPHHSAPHQTHNNLNDQKAAIKNIQTKTWPFARVDYEKFIALTGSSARAMENAILATAGDIGIDVRVKNNNKNGERDEAQKHLI